MKLYVCVLVALLAVSAVDAYRAGAGRAGALPRVFGGEDVDADEFPWLASLQWLNPETNEHEHRCPGVLISSVHVLTSGSCISSQTSMGFSWLPDRVALGVVDLEDLDDADFYTPIGGGFAPMYGLERHDNNDLGLIGLTTAVDAKYTPIILFNPLTGVGLEEAGKPAILVGWGGHYVNDVLTQHTEAQKVEIEIKSNRECHEAYSEVTQKEVILNLEGGVISQEMLCAGGFVNAGGCGDSGAPLVQEYDGKWFLLAVGMYGRYCMSGAPMIFSRISPSFSWISEFTGGQVSHGPNNLGSGGDSDAPLTAPFVREFWDVPAFTPGAFSCSTGETIHGVFVCDGIKDCVDGLDERSCACGAGYADAETGTRNGNCIPYGKFCDGMEDSPEGGDEKFCGAECDAFPISPPGDYTCDRPNTCAAFPGTTCRGGACVDALAVNQCFDSSPLTSMGDMTCKNPRRDAAGNSLDCSQFPGLTCRDYWCVDFTSVRRPTFFGACDDNPITPPGDNTCTTLCAQGKTCRAGTCYGVGAISANLCCDDIDQNPRGDGTCNANLALNCANFDNYTCRDHWCLPVDMIKEC